MKNKYLLILLLLSSIFLFACNLTNTFSNKIEQQIETVQDNQTSEEITVPEQTPEITNIQPTQDVEEALPTTQAEILTDPPVEAENACYHPYFPISEGAYWVFQDTSGEGYTLGVSEVGKNSFTLIQEIPGEDTSFTVEWFCSESGILSGSFSQVDLFHESSEFEEMPEIVFETLEWEGETLPDPALMQPGYAWISNYKMSAEMNLEGMMQSFETDVTIEHEINTIEEVVTPAGTFPESIRVDSTGIVDMVLRMGEFTTPFSGIEFNYSTWYAEGVGMVKTDNQYAGFENLVELKEYGLTE